MNNITIEVLAENDIEEYSALINEVMEEFNQEEVDDFQMWFASVEGITHRRKYGFDDGSMDTVQFAAKYNGKIIGALEIENKSHIQSFFVNKEFHNMGIGKSLLKYSTAFFEKNSESISGYTILSSDYAIDIYKSLGFKGEGKDLYWDVGHSGRIYSFFMYSKWEANLEGIPWMRELKVS